MQRVLQRTARAQRVAAKKAERWKKIQEKDEEKYTRRQRGPQVKTLSKSRRETYEKRQQDWDMGPLAPRRDVGAKPHLYGTVHAYNSHSPARVKTEQTSMDHIREGDRVAVIRGPERGKIDTVVEIAEEGQTVRLKNTGRIDIALMPWMRGVSGKGEEGGDIEEGYHSYAIEDIRLVFPLKDPETGIPRDVVIEKLEVLANRPYLDEAGVTRYHSDKEDNKYRVIPGTNTIIPWPEKAEDAIEDEHEVDTVSTDVVETTFDVPPLLYPPMPMGVIDELRNKYSRFRKRHDWSYVEKKEAEDRKVAARSNLIDQMKSPLQELNELRARQRAAQQKDLTEEQLAKIGEVIAREKGGAVGQTKALPA